ncbi:MAG: hypothetical protein U1F81_15565 [Verrucomicrobiaceae bacterium]
MGDSGIHLGSAGFYTTINVLGGTYTENVDATGNSVTLAPGASTSSKVVINGSLVLDATEMASHSM